MKIITVKKLFFILILLIASSYLSPANAQYRLRGGFRIGVYSNTQSTFLGGEILAPIGNNWNINPNIEYVFIHNQTYVSFNLDFDYFAPIDVRDLYLWAGGGAGLIYTKQKFSQYGETNLGINLLFGIGIQAGNVEPYFQPEIVLKNNPELALGFGIRF